MPTYEYVCEKCGYKFERFQQMLDKPLRECPQCNGKLKRLIGKGMGIIFKGSKFPATDYKNKGVSNMTCCGRIEQCSESPCSDNGVCKR
jgi:putative FmdB family regulatory protein